MFCIRQRFSAFSDHHSHAEPPRGTEPAPGTPPWPGIKARSAAGPRPTAPPGRAPCNVSSCCSVGCSCTINRPGIHRAAPTRRSGAALCCALSFNGRFVPQSGPSCLWRAAQKGTIRRAPNNCPRSRLPKQPAGVSYGPSLIRGDAGSGNARPRPCRDRRRGPAPQRSTGLPQRRYPLPAEPSPSVPPPA